MKKLLVVLLALSMVFAFAACGKQADTAPKEGLTAIPLGGDLPDIPVEGDAYGIYEPIDFPEGAEAEIANLTSAELYYAEGSNTPYIAVYRWANENNNALEDETAVMAKKFGVSYSMVPWKAIGQDEIGYYVAPFEKDGNFYYVEADLIVDGNDFVEIDYFQATEEIALGETGQYLNVPTGYTDLLNDDEIAHGTIFFGEYAEGFDIPRIWIGKLLDDSYASLEWFYGGGESEGFSLDEQTYNDLLAQAEKSGWTNDLSKAFYDALGIKYEKSESVKTDSGILADCIYTTVDESKNAEIYFYIGEDCYGVTIVARNGQAYANALVASCHTK